MCVCVWERERERECVCAFVAERDVSHLCCLLVEGVHYCLVLNFSFLYIDVKCTFLDVHLVRFMYLVHSRAS